MRIYSRHASTKNKAIIAKGYHVAALATHKANGTVRDDNSREAKHLHVDVDLPISVFN